MYSLEEIQTRIDAYLDAGSDMEEVLQGCIGNHKTINALTEALEATKHDVLYGAEASREDISRIETIMIEICNIMDRRKERADKVIKKLRRYLERIISLLEQIPLPDSISAAIAALTERLVLIHRSYQQDLNGLLQVIRECQKKLRELQELCHVDNGFPPELSRIFVEMQNLLFDDYHYFEKDLAERNHQEELVSPDIRKHMEKMGRMSPELNQLLIDTCWLASENNQLTNPIAEMINHLNSSDEIEKINERTDKALNGEYTDEELEKLFADIDAFMPNISDMTARGKALEEATGKQIEKIKTMTGALSYYAGE